MYAFTRPLPELYGLSLVTTLTIAEKTRRSSMERNEYMVGFAGPDEVPSPMFQSGKTDSKSQVLLVVT